MKSSPPASQNPSSEARTVAEPQKAAENAGLRYVNDEQPGIRRQKRGKGFPYLLPSGNAVIDPKTLERIRRLAIPPAYQEVWICPQANGHIQATGRDAKGRKGAVSRMATCLQLTRLSPKQRDFRP